MFPLSTDALFERFRKPLGYQPGLREESSRWRLNPLHAQPAPDPGNSHRVASHRLGGTLIKRDNRSSRLAQTWQTQQFLASVGSAWSCQIGDKSWPGSVITSALSPTSDKPWPCGDHDKFRFPLANRLRWVNVNRHGTREPWRCGSQPNQKLIAIMPHREP